MNQAPAKQIEQPSPVSAEAARRGPAPGATILLVEDEPGLAEVLTVHLQSAGYQVVTVPDGLQALYALDEQPPSLVLLDLNLPLVSGFRIIQLLKQRGASPKVPVLVLTALSYQEAEDAVRAGADDFLTKPFLPQEVVARVQRLLDVGVTR